MPTAPDLGTESRTTELSMTVKSQSPGEVSKFLIHPRVAAAGPRVRRCA